MIRIGVTPAADAGWFVISRELELGVTYDAGTWMVFASMAGMVGDARGCGYDYDMIWYAQNGTVRICGKAREVSLLILCLINSMGLLFSLYII